MSRPAFIVDGEQEQKILQKLCPGSPIKRLNCNGENVELSAAAERAASLIRLIGQAYYPIIVIFDREKRQDSADQVRQELYELIAKEGVCSQVIVGVPDRMIENWILASWNTISTRCQFKGARPGIIEGQNGKSLIKRKLPKGRYYHETIEGVDWFVHSDACEIYTNSSSFKTFADSVSSLNCKWLKLTPS